MPRFPLKVLMTDIAEGWRQRFCAVATITTKGDRMVIAVGKGEPRVIANYKGRWFHISLGCVRWVVGFKSFSDQQQLLQCSCQQRQRNHIACPIRHLRLVAEKRRKSDYSDSGISSSRFRDAASQNSPQNGSCSNASAPLPPRRFITTNEPPCASAI